MALKALMLRKKLEQKNAEMEVLRGAENEFATREAEIESMIAEAETEEEQRAVEEEISSFNENRSENKKKIDDLEAEIRELESELEAEEAEQDTDPVPTEEVREHKTEERGKEIMQIAEKRNRFGITDEMVKRDDVNAFLAEVRTAAMNKRSLSNAGLLIPEVFLGMIKENVINYSKLYSRVYARALNGEGKLTVMGTIPEAVWTACCGIINEADISFSNVTVDCNKVAAFIPVCNAILEDNDVNLAAEIMEALLISLGKALDKAILYGTGSGMPMGIYTRLAQSSEPGTYPSTMRPWVDLHTSHLFTISNSVTGTGLFQTIMLDSAVMSGKYSRGELTWCMNDTTYKFLKAQGMNVNAAGELVSAVNGEMPVAGGDVVVLDFIPNYNIIAGYYDLYLLADRKSMTVESTEYARFIEDETIFRGKARYDGIPVIAEAFAGFAINGGSFSAPSFTSDVANTPAYILLDKNSATVTAAAGSGHTVTLHAMVLNANGQILEGQSITYASSASGKASVTSAGVVTGASAGSAVITATCGSATGVCNVTVS